LERSAAAQQAAVSTQREFFFTLVTGPIWSLSLKLSDAPVYEPETRALLGIASHFCEAVVLKKLKTHLQWMAGDLERSAAAQQAAVSTESLLTTYWSESTLSS